MDRRTVLKGGLAGAAGIGLGPDSPFVRAADKPLSLMVLGPNQDAIKWLTGALAIFKSKIGYDVEIGNPTGARVSRSCSRPRPAGRSPT